MVSKGRFIFRCFLTGSKTPSGSKSSITPTSSSTSLKSSGGHARDRIVIEAVVPTVVVFILLFSLLVFLFHRQRRRKGYRASHGLPRNSQRKKQKRTDVTTARRSRKLPDVFLKYNRICFFSSTGIFIRSKRRD